MIGRGFKSVGWVAGVGAAALGCYLLSLQVATERADLARVERQIISTKQQIRSLQTELGTRGRLTQLEQWNNDVLALAAPASGQFLQDEFTLARLETHDTTVADSAPVRMAALETGDTSTSVAPAATAKPAPAVALPGAGTPAVRSDLVHRASFAEPPSRVAAASTPPPKPAKAAPPQDSAKGKAIVPTRAIATATAEASEARPIPARPTAAKPTARTGADRAAAGVATTRTQVARADSAPAAPARAATARISERGSTVRAESGASARPAAARPTIDRPTSGRAAAVGGATGKK